MCRERFVEHVQALVGSWERTCRTAGVILQAVRVAWVTGLLRWFVWKGKRQETERDVSLKKPVKCLYTICIYTGCTYGDDLVTRGLVDGEFPVVIAVYTVLVILCLILCGLLKEACFVTWEWRRVGSGIWDKTKGPFEILPPNCQIPSMDMHKLLAIVKHKNSIGIESRDIELSTGCKNQ